MGKKEIDRVLLRDHDASRVIIEPTKKQVDKKLNTFNRHLDGRFNVGTLDRFVDTALARKRDNEHEARRRAIRIKRKMEEMTK